MNKLTVSDITNFAYKYFNVNKSFLDATVSKASGKTYAKITIVRDFYTHKLTKKMIEKFKEFLGVEDVTIEKEEFENFLGDKKFSVTVYASGYVVE